MHATPEPRCPPHRLTGLDGLCELCGRHRDELLVPPAWERRALASAYPCDGCRAYLQIMATVYRHGNAHLCEACHEARIAAASKGSTTCVVCGAETLEDAQTCGAKCARALRRRAARGHEGD